MKKKQEDLAKKRKKEQDRISPPVPEEKKIESDPPTSNKPDKALLWLGWTSLLAIPYMLVFMVSPAETLFYFLLVLEPVTLLMQLRLHKRGLTRIFRNEKVSKVFRTACTWISVILVFLMIIIICALFSLVVEAGGVEGITWWNIFPIGILIIYYFLWTLFYATEG